MMSRTFKLLLYLLLLLVALLVLTWTMDTLVMPRYTRQTVGRVLPDVQNLNLLEAQRQLGHLQLQSVVDSRRSSLSPAGTVIYQTPQPGIEVKPGRRIHLTVSSGRASLVLPKLIGRSSRQVELALNDAGLPLEQVLEQVAFDSLAPRGVVIGQSVAAGDSLRLDDTLTIIISLGFPVDSLLVPDILRQSEVRARRSLLLQGLKIGEIEYQYYAAVSPDQV
ncbi:MAG: PASTA domain-containing protein, partial [Candidatus Delongbacteria bacterium]|nr:PASTA domain-containing protein [Candidatus Delongbacteria bacterium]